MRLFNRKVRRFFVIGGLVTATMCVFVARPASAHPLGNFTVNRYARVELSGDIVRVYYVLDQAEIPTFQDRDALDRDRTAFIEQRREEIRRHLRLTIDGAAVDLVPAETSLTLPEGQGGLPTLRLAIRFEAEVPSRHDEHSLQATFADDNEPDRVGWREIVVVARGDAQLETSSAPSEDLSRELTDYPGDLLQAPLDLREVSFAFAPGDVGVAPEAFVSSESAPDRSGGGFAGLINRDNVTPVALAGMIGLALLFGAGHALAPGHGKTVMAAYLVGTRGRPIDAVLLGVIVSAMHTASVLVLAGVLYQVNRSAQVDRVYPALTIASGLLVVGLGVGLAVARTRHMRRRRPRVPHVHFTVSPIAPVAIAAPVRELVAVGGGHAHHDAHDHPHDHSHGHSHEHVHGRHTHTHELPDDVPPLSRRGLVLLATSGGLLPSPSAVVVLLAAFAAGRAALGLGLVAAFSIGLAITLTAVGLVLVLGGRAIERKGLRHRRITRWLPVASAVAIATVGTIITLEGVSQL